MNSIFGTIGQVEDTYIEKMADLLAHRGKIKHVEHFSKNVVFGCGCSAPERRIFLEENYIIASDASIYNLDEVKEFLREKGNYSGSENKEELLLRLFDLHGVPGIEKVNGDFAFAIWDKINQRLILGRDFLGCHPLYYVELVNGGLAFASEYKALLALPHMTIDPDQNMLQHLQYHKKLPIGKTLSKNICAVQPGCVQIFLPAGNEIDAIKMSPINSSVNTYSETEAADDVISALEKAIECRVDNPRLIGIALSGGIDSIGITFICRKLFPDAEIHTYTAGFGENDIEMQTAANVARVIDSNHHPVQTPPSLMKNHLEKLVWHLEDPFARSEALQLFKIGEAASQNVKSLLCGMEADALFAGMPRHKILWLMKKFSFLKDYLAEFYDFTQAGLMPQSVVGKSMVRFHFGRRIAPVPRIIGSDYRPAASVFPKERHQFINKFLSAAFQSGACQDGQKLERPFAAWGVSYRSPFLDRNVIRTAFSVSDDLKIKYRANKYILRKALRSVVSEEFLSVRKRPQKMKYDREFAQTIDELSNDYLNEQRVSDRNFFKFQDIEKLKRLKKNDTYSEEAGMRIWTAMLTEIWAKIFVDEKGEMPSMFNKNLRDTA
jgi:asparagine synthase (glutamine-hydrolysing)